jgi:hypothetical protein
MREKWEQQESEMRKKEDIHYQDILFDGRSIDTLFNVVITAEMTALLEFYERSLNIN